MKEQNKQLSEKAKEAEKIKQNFSEDIKLATEAMKRTMRHRKTRIILETRSVYQQII